MAKLNQIECVTGYKNVGFGTCVFDPKLIAGMLLFPGAKSFTANEVAEIEATLIAAAKADTKGSRMFPIHKFVAVTDNTEDVVIQTFDYGAKQIVRDGDYDMKFQYLDGALCLHTALRTFNGPTPFLLYDKKNNLIGTKKNGLLSTIPPHFFYAEPWKMAGGSTVAAYMVRVSFLPDYINENIGYVPAGFDLKEIEGLKDVEVVVNSYNEGTGVANVTLQTLCNKVNLFDQYSTVLNDEALWVSSDKELGSAITITSVAAGLNKTFNVTLDTADVDYPAAGGAVLLNLAVPSILAAAGVAGYEGEEAEIALAAS